MDSGADSHMTSTSGNLLSFQQLGFVGARSYISLFIYRHGSDIIYLLLYVDDIILTASSDALLHRVIDVLTAEFYWKDFGRLHHFLGVSVTKHNSGLFLIFLSVSGCLIASHVLLRLTLVPSSLLKAPSVPDATHYRGLAGALHYFTFSRPDIAYAIEQVCLYMHDPRKPHLALVKRILRYICGTLDYGLQLHHSSVADLIAYSDADQVSCLDTRRSTSGYRVFLRDNMISWSSKRQHTVSRSSAEAEYRVVANAIAEAYWLRQLFKELHSPPHQATAVYCDNISAVYLSINPCIEINLHFVHDKVYRSRLFSTHHILVCGHLSMQCRYLH
jgi:hypothetical protein